MPDHFIKVVDGQDWYDIDTEALNKLEPAHKLFSESKVGLKRVPGAGTEDSFTLPYMDREVRQYFLLWLRDGRLPRGITDPEKIDRILRIAKVFGLSNLRFELESVYPNRADARSSDLVIRAHAYAKQALLLASKSKQEVYDVLKRQRQETAGQPAYLRKLNKVCTTYNQLQCQNADAKTKYSFTGFLTAKHTLRWKDLPADYLLGCLTLSELSPSEASMIVFTLSCLGLQEAAVGKCTERLRALLNDPKATGIAIKYFVRQLKIDLNRLDSGTLVQLANILAPDGGMRPFADSDLRPLTRLNAPVFRACPCPCPGERQTR